MIWPVIKGWAGKALGWGAGMLGGWQAKALGAGLLVTALGALVWVWHAREAKLEAQAAQIGQLQERLGTLTETLQHNAAETQRLLDQRDAAHQATLQALQAEATRRRTVEAIRRDLKTIDAPNPQAGPRTQHVIDKLRGGQDE